ncbi:hypothetical protein Nos7524_1706 [Nostoc sp. PCC 7524]|jgi:hypothetical protein|nr:hypothetical protein Nos7524_1706 [Nostoc sp. PCC 7524]
MYLYVLLILDIVYDSFVSLLLQAYEKFRQ